MEHFLTGLLGQTHGLVAYAMVYAILVLCGLGLPLPEDVTLMLGGYLAYSRAADSRVMVAVAFLGILTGDSTIFFFGRRTGRNLKPNSFIGRLVTPEKLAKVEALFAKYGQKIVMAARFMPGVRAGVFFAAGASGLAYWQFVLFDGLAACISVPLLVLLAKHFGGEITHFMMVAKRAQFTVLVVAFGLVLGWVGLQRARAKRKAQEAEAAKALETKLPEPAPQEQVEQPAQPVESRTTH
ncbi:MAG: DedA family protein [Deltaproteobacteria bacterium]|nr:DedA family protein [Deltaproteobacteria bacterium]